MLSGALVWLRDNSHLDASALRCLPLDREKFPQGAMQLRAEEEARKNAMMIGELRALAYGLMASRGKTRVAKQRALDLRLAEFGLRPLFRGGARLPASERPTIRALYAEYRAVIDCFRAEARALGLEEDRDAREALLIRYPFFAHEDLDRLCAFPYSRRGATAEAAVWMVARRYGVRPATVNRYLFPR